MTRIRADRDVCIGSGMCARTAPHIFDQDADDGRVRLRTEHPEERDLELVREAVDLCPSGALSLRDSRKPH